LESLAAAATRIMSAESNADIAATVTDFATDMTTVTSCVVVPVSEPATAQAAISGRSTEGHIRIPLRVDDATVLGHIDLTGEHADPPDPEDVQLVQQLALMASHRMDLLRRYRRERDISHTLQRSLLPDTLPQLPQIDIVARYRPAAATDDVGGDWYDALLLPDGRLMVTVGDVMGHDLAAAVTMGQIRLLLRARSADSASPAELCTTVNRLMATVGTPKLATMIVAFIDLTNGCASLVNAGHPLPILRTPTHTAPLTVPASLPLGVTATTVYHETGATLPPGSTLLMYTDGLIERRDEPLSVSCDKLRRLVADLDVTALDAAVDILLDAHAANAHDDIAVLALRRPAYDS
jgi:serine phosphatase RsbU (regulator of sigma subunit)